MKRDISTWIALLALLLVSCSTLRKDQKHLALIEVRNPQLLADACATKYPPKLLPPVIKEGATVYLKGDTVRLPGVRIPCPPGGTDTVWKECPPSVVIHDTLNRVDTVFQPVVNTAEIASRDYELMELRGEFRKAQDKASRWRKAALWEGAALLLIAIGVFVKLKFFRG